MKLQMLTEIHQLEHTQEPRQKHDLLFTLFLVGFKRI